ncbi:hypothetical protein, partial [Pseudoalteromonas luteoviolacea]
MFANKPVYVENQVDFSTSESSIVYNGKLYFPGRDLEHGTELWVYDKKVGQARMVANYSAGNQSFGPSSFIEYKGKIYFYGSSSELYSFDDTTQKIEKVTLDNGSSLYLNTRSPLVALNGKLFCATK